jgi:hypothetical protein
MEKQSHSGFLVFSTFMLITISIAALIPLYPNDFWPYLRIGQEILKTGSLPTIEFMTFTQFGNPAVYLYWLPSLLFLKIYTLGGVTLVGIVSVLCISCFYSLLWLCLREFKVGPLTSWVVLLSVVLVGVNYWSTRPQIFTYPLFGFIILAILRWHKGDNRLLWIVPVLAVLWANLHGSFIVIFFLTLPALLFGEGNRKKMAIVIGLALLATLINPYGVGLWSNMLAMVNNTSIKLYSLEWRPPANQSWQENIFFATLLLIPVLTAFTRPKIQTVYWIWFLGFGWMALSSARYIAWFLPVEAILLALLLKPIFDPFIERSNRFPNAAINRVVGVILLIFPLCLLPGIRGLWWQQAPSVYKETTPIQATAWLKQNPQLPGELWSDYSYSTYLAYALPERKLFMTNRFEDFPPSQFLDDNHIANAYSDWETLLDKYGVNILMTGIKIEPGLIKAVSASADWKEVYADTQTLYLLTSFLRGVLKIGHVC